jgi:hypothetical protein
MGEAPGDAGGHGIRKTVAAFKKNGREAAP